MGFIYFSYKAQSSVKVLPFVSGTNIQAKITAKIKTQPWTKKMPCIPINMIIEGIALMKMKTVMHL